MSEFKPCALVPVYDHPHFLPTLIAALVGYGLHIILVDDGSGEACAGVIDALTSRYDLHLVRHPQNCGKGVALVTGLRTALQLGFSHALQIDADGQHTVDDVPTLLAAAQEAPAAIITGRPIYDESVPLVRFLGRYLTHVLVWINTLSLAIPDTMCGFRVYPVQTCCDLLAKHRFGPRMSFETEILVHFFWRGGEVVSIPTRVRYPENGISHFRMLEDNLRLISMHVRLLFGMLIRLPYLLLQRWQRR